MCRIPQRFIERCSRILGQSGSDIRLEGRRRHPYPAPQAIDSRKGIGRVAREHAPPTPKAASNHACHAAHHTLPSASDRRRVACGFDIFFINRSSSYEPAEDGLSGDDIRFKADITVKRIARPPPFHPSRMLPAADGTPDRERPADGRPEVLRQGEEGAGLVEGGA